MYDKADNTLTICLKYVVDGNEDVPIRKIQRQRILNSNGYLGFLYDYAGMDKTIVRFAEDVLKEALSLFDKAEKGRYVKMSIIDVYKEVIAVVENGEQESETTKKRRKTVEINETNGNVVKYVCVRGTKEMASILKEIGSPYSRAHFLESIKNIKNIKNKKNGLEEKREFLKVSEGRHYDYTETGGTHWTYLRVYEDLLEEGTVCTQN